MGYTIRADNGNIPEYTIYFPKCLKVPIGKMAAQKLITQAFW